MNQCEKNSFLIERELELLHETEKDVPNFPILSMRDYVECLDNAMGRVDRIQAQAKKELEEILKS